MGLRRARRLRALLGAAVGCLLVAGTATAAGLVLASPTGAPAAPGPPPSLVAATAPAALPAAPVPASALAPAAPTPAPATTPAAPAPDPAVPARLATLPAATTQAILVDSADPAATSATVSAWTRTAGGWAAALPPTPAFLGRAGMGASSERTTKTPEGTFTITQAFGRAANPGTALPYLRVGPDDWWVGDTASPLYNTHQRCAPGTCPFDEQASENLEDAGHAYDHAIVIDANTDPTRPGAGSAYFLHIYDHPTAGCVGTDEGTVVALLRLLTPAAHPVISLATG